MAEVTISLAQMPVIVGEPEQNRDAAWEMAGEAAGRDTTLLLLPELWGSGYDLTRAERHATDPKSGMFREMAEMAREYRMWVGGSLLGYEREGQARARNVFALFAPDGTLAARYAKLHLFRLMDEDQWLEGGEAPVLTRTPWGACGLSICYDLRFPELFRGYALQGARMILMPAQWPHPRLAHWRTLLRARAIENQYFVVACNRVGEDPNGTRFFGYSAILDPWGEPVAEGGEEATLLTATIDLSLVDEVRGRIPVWEDRRPELY